MTVLSNRADDPRASLLLGWSHLAADDAATAFEPLRIAGQGDDPQVAGWAALLLGLTAVSLRRDDIAVVAWNWAWNSDVHEICQLLNIIDFSAGESARVADAAVCRQLGLEDSQPVLPRLLASWDADSRFSAALGLCLVHSAHGNYASAVTAASQAVSAGHSRHVGAAWLELGEAGVGAGDKATAAGALRQAIETSATGQPPAVVVLGLTDEAEIDVPTRAKTLLGAVHRDLGDIEQALAVLTDAARGNNVQATLVLAQTLDASGADAAARAAYEHVVAEGGQNEVANALLYLGGMADRGGDHDTATAMWTRAVDIGDPEIFRSASFSLGIVAKDRRDLAEAARWLEPIVESGTAKAALAAAHLGELCYWLGDREGTSRWYGFTLANTDDPKLIAESKARLSEVA